MTEIATIAFIMGIVMLFVLDRDPTVRTSHALCLPVAWLLIAGSRPVSVWLEMAPLSSPEQYLEGSPFDRNIYIALLAIGLVVLVRRQSAVLSILRANLPIILFVVYCAISITWSDYPEVAFKRWIKSLGDLVMILIVLTDHDWSYAFRRVLSRVAFILLPISILLIKYYPALGRIYSLHWDGTVFYVGVANDKNMLGMTCLVFGLGSSWQFIQELADQRRRRILVAHGTIVLMAVWLLRTCDSMTSLTCLVLASGLIAVTTFMRVFQRRAAVHLLVAVLLLACISPLFLGMGNGVLSTIGRNSTLTGRTELWNELINMTVNPIVGAGFESFWLGKRLEQIWSLHWWHPNESHNGYLEIYLNLGWIGISLLALMIVTGYRNIMRILGDHVAARLLLAYFFVGIVYDFTEAAIRTMGAVWFVFLLALVAVPADVLPCPEPSEIGLLTYQPQSEECDTLLATHELHAMKSQ